MRLLIHFARFGPYHHARLRAAHEVLSPHGWEVIGLETAGNDATYAWDEAHGDADGPKVVTVFPGRVHEEITAAEYRQTLLPLLDSLKPTAMAIAGWGSVDARLCLGWCRKHGVRRMVMSETRAADGKRVWWKEFLKRQVVSRFDGALVGAKSHRDYLTTLGIKPERIALGYNVVDNGYFREKTLEIGNSKLGQETQYPNNSISNIHSPYFLASNRFIERKNLSRLLEAYASYLQKSTIGNLQSEIWHLCLLGDGDLKPALLAKSQELGLNVIEAAPWESSLKTENLNLKTHPNHGVVWMPGFRQIDELPRFYAHAGCFVHPALEEPWGLVINEAMACGLPVLSSNNVGAAEELVDDGVNGWTFDPGDSAGMAAALTRIATLPPEQRAAFGTASRRILEERCPTRAFGEGLAKLLAASPRPWPLRGRP